METNVKYPVYNVQFLSVLEMGCSLPNEQINSYYQALPLFQNVIELRLSWCSTVLHYWIDVVKMLESCPKLQVLYIDKWIVSPTTEDYPIHVPECVSGLNVLKTCPVVQGSLQHGKYENVKAQESSSSRSSTVQPRYLIGVQHAPQSIGGLFSELFDFELVRVIEEDQEVTLLFLNQEDLIVEEKHLHIMVCPMGQGQTNINSAVPKPLYFE
ncbi:hypothetical protein P8452_18460 [Trifolium repens]|nr:hypothetical protein P8452_18460 [Trifolium repens]